jgi:hypothetical protein
VPAPRETPTRESVDAVVQKAGVSQRLGGGAHAEAVAARSAPPFERRRVGVHAGHVDLAGDVAPIAFGVEDGRRADPALAREHAPPAFLARRAESGDEPDPRHRDPPAHATAERSAAASATARRSPALAFAATATGMN